jgi:hypothetical protein
MSWALWGPVFVFVVLFSTGLRWAVVASAVSGLAAGMATAGDLDVDAHGILHDDLFLELIVINAAMILAEGVVARLVGGGRVIITLTFAALGHAAFFFLVFRGMDTALIWFLSPLALAGGSAGAVGGWLTRSKPVS